LGRRRPGEDAPPGGPRAVRGGRLSDQALSDRGRFEGEAGRAIFIAAPLSDDAKAAISELVARVQARAPGTRPGARAGERAVRWVRLDGLHLTLRYLGRVPTSEWASLAAATRTAATVVGPFDVELSGAGAFPDPRRPRTLWLAASRGADALAALNQVVDDAVERAGLGRDPRPFRAHLTLARSDGVAGGAETVRVLLEEARGLAVRWRVSELVLFESVTGGGPARYVPLEIAPLTGDAG
jgi:2'-5' RNA ligase